jgi:16S rRNA (cytosine967-C5)-methyltransferase
VDPRHLNGPRAAALWVIERALVGREPADGLRWRADERLEPRDRALLHQLVTGVLRWLLRLDHVLVSVSRRPIGEIDGELLGPLRLGAYQLLFLDRVPKHAAVDTSVELAKRRHPRGAGFVNAVLRKVAAVGDLAKFPVEVQDRIDRLAVETSHPPFLVDRWISRFGVQATRELLETNNRDRCPSLLATAGRGSRDRVIGRLSDDGVHAIRSTVSPMGLLVREGRPLATVAFEEGLVYPQDEASQCAVLIPLPREGELVLDAAAAPGGKTLSLLAWEPSLRVVAADVSIDRLETLSANLRRSRRPFRVLASDAVRPGVSSGFDRVVADLPCSGTGTIRKHPELKWRVDAGEIGRLTAAARAMLDGLAPLVARGGLLVAITCSIEPEENEEQLGTFLDRHPEFSLLDLRRRVLETMRGQLETEARWRLFPAEEHDGFTVHALRRNASE